MSPATAAFNRLRELSRKIFIQNAHHNADRTGYPSGLCHRASQSLFEQLEPRLMLSAAVGDPTLLWSQQIGTASSDESDAVVVDGSGSIYITGETTGDLGGTNAGNQDAFLTKYELVTDADRRNMMNAQNLGAIGNAAKTIKWWIGKTATSEDHNDWFKFTVTGARKITATLTGLSRNANLQLIDEDGDVLKTCTRTGTSNEVLNCNVMPKGTGTYYLRVHSGSKTRTRYTLSGKAVADTEKNTWKRAANLGIPTAKFKTVNDRIGAVDTNDWYKFTVRGIKKARIILDQFTAPAGVGIELFRVVEGTPSASVASEEQRKDDTSLSMTEVLKAGTYYIQVSSTYKKNSPYRLRVCCKGDADIPIRTKARNLGFISAAVKAFNGRAGGEDRNDWFKFSTKGNFRRQVTVTLKNVGNLDLRLYDAKGRLMNTSATLGDSNEEIVRNLKAGTYYVRVFVGAETNLDDLLTYTLELSAPKVGSTPT